MEIQDVEYGLDINFVEVDSKNRVKLKFAKDGNEEMDFIDPKSVRHLNLMCRESDNLPSQIAFFENVRKILIGGGNFTQVDNEFNHLRHLESIVLFSSNLQFFPLKLLLLPSLNFLSIISNLYELKVPKEVCSIKKEMVLYFLGTSLDDEFECLKNNKNLLILQ